jgi:TonB family protein
MERQDLKDAQWIWIGFRFGLGFCGAGLIFALVFHLVIHLIGHHRATVPPSPPPPPVYVNPDTRAAPPPAAPAPAPVPQAGHLHVVVPPKDGKTCMEEAHGLIDERYEDCLKGRDYWTDDRGAALPAAADAAAAQAVPDDWAVQLSAAVVRAWTVPPGTKPNLKAIVNITMGADGEVQAAFIDSGSGVKAFDDSLLKAVTKASPLPLPGKPEEFAPSVKICFSPDAKNCL